MEGINNKDEVTLFRYNKYKVIISGYFFVFFFISGLVAVIALSFKEGFEKGVYIITLMLPLIVIFIYLILDLWFRRKSMLKVKITNQGFYVFKPILFYIFFPFKDVFIPLEDIKEINTVRRGIIITTTNDKIYFMHLWGKEYYQVKMALYRLSMLDKLKTWY
jgi:hypothetical protein